MEKYPGRDAAHTTPGTWASLLPQVVVYVHLSVEQTDHDIARVEGRGPVTPAWVRDHLSRHARVTVRPVLDIEGQAPVDA